MYSNWPNLIGKPIHFKMISNKNNSFAQYITTLMQNPEASPQRTGKPREQSQRSRRILAGPQSRNMSYSQANKGNKTQFQTFTMTAKMPDLQKEGKIIVDIIREEQKKRLRLKINTRHMMTFFPTYTTIQSQASMHLLNPNVVMHNLTNTKEQKLGAAEHNAIIQRKKLVPIKKSKNDKRAQSRYVEESFLNVKKFSSFSSTRQKSEQNSHKQLSATDTLLAKNTMDLSRKSLYKQSRMERPISRTLNPIEIHVKQITEKREQKYSIAMNKEQGSIIARNKPFSPPFQRYHYFDFLWKVAYSNSIKLQIPQTLCKKYKAYVGPGNNSNLIKTLLKRRFSWWALTDKMEEAQFIWTQLKVNSVYTGQENYTPPLRIECHEDNVNLKTAIYQRNRKIMNDSQTKQWIKYFNANREQEEKINKGMGKRSKCFRQQASWELNPSTIKVHNHIPRNYVIGNKKALFTTMKKYYQSTNRDVFEYLPLTFHIEKGTEDPEFYAFLKHYYAKSKSNKQKAKSRNIWIVKPGEFTNRGNGIVVCHSLEEVKQILRNKVRLENGGIRTYILQEYLERPFLYCRRKFDIRHYMLMTFVNGHIKGYWYQEGYIRTTSYEYSLNHGYSSVHLTNDAVQKNLPDYGKYEKGNKLSYEDFQKYLEREYDGKYSFFQTIYPQLKSIAYDSMRASALLLDPDRKGHNFQIFGFDFMIDSKFHPWLIEINTNPCLEISCPVLMDVIPGMLENALKIGLDSLLPPTQNFEEKRPRFSNNVLQDNKFQLLFDSAVEESELSDLLFKQQGPHYDYKELEKDQDDFYEDDGVQLDD